MNRRCVAAILLGISIIAACGPSDAGQEPDEVTSPSPSPTVNENPNPDDGY